MITNKVKEGDNLKGENVPKYELLDPQDRIKWLGDMHDGICSEEIDDAYIEAMSPLLLPVELVKGVVTKLAGIEIGTRYLVGGVEYSSADQVIGVLGKLCTTAIASTSAAIDAGSVLAEAVDCLKQFKPEDADLELLDKRMRAALVECLANLQEYDRLIGR
jgi:hypothetical protein